MLVRLNKVVMTLMVWLMGFGVQAQDLVPVALLSSDRQSILYEAVSEELARVKQASVDLCNPQAIVVVFFEQDLQNLEAICPTPQAIFSVGLSVTDALLKRPNVTGYFATRHLSRQLEAAQQWVEGPLTVLYSEQAELSSIQDFQKKHPQQELTLIQVSSSAQAIKSLGRGILKTSAVVLGSNPDIFNETFLITARKMSLKFLTPLVGGSSSDFLKKGTVFGVFVTDADAQQALKQWLATGQFIAPPETLIINHKMLSYFGLVPTHE